MGHILERPPDNITNGLRPSRAINTYLGEYEQVFLGQEDSSRYNDRYNSLRAQPSYSGIFNARKATTYYGDQYSDYDWSSNNGTDTDTASSNLGEAQDLSDIAHLAEEEQEQELFWAMERAKKRWRHFRKG